MKKFLKKAVILIAIILPFMLFAQEETVFTITPASVVSVYDGDTFKINVPNCEIPVLCKNVPVRVLGIDTPEITGKSQTEKQMAKNAKQITTTFLKASKSICLSCGRDKYFRLNCSVSNETGMLNPILIKYGLAVPYDGGTKTKDWSISK